MQWVTPYVALVTGPLREWTMRTPSLQVETICCLDPIPSHSDRSFYKRTCSKGRAYFPRESTFFSFFFVMPPSDAPLSVSRALVPPKKTRSLVSVRCSAMRPTHHFTYLAIESCDADTSLAMRHLNDGTSTFYWLDIWKWSTTVLAEVGYSGGDGFWFQKKKCPTMDSAKWSGVSFSIFDFRAWIFCVCYYCTCKSTFKLRSITQLLYLRVIATTESSIYLWEASYHMIRTSE